MRISGLASGMDTDTMVKQLMAVARVPLDTVNQKKQTLEWQRESYREINSKIVDFRNNKLSNYRLTQTLNTQKATVSGDTNALKATATSSANGISMSVVVDRLATKTGIENKLTAKDSSRVTNTTKLGLLVNSGGSDLSLTINEGTENESIIKFSSEDTIATAVGKINSSGKATAVFDEVTGQLSITAKEYGTKKDQFKLTGTFMNFFEGKPLVDGQKSKVFINGQATAMEFDSNSINVNGVQMNLTAKSDFNNPSIITIEQDSSSVVETVKAFVQQYNDLLSLLNSKTNEEKYRDYAPLTDAQKEEMSEDEIEKWTEKSKSGLLKNDSILKSAVSSMRSEITSYLKASNGLSLTDLGITTGQYNEGGKLYLNEEKLKTAVQSNPSGVAELFQGSATDTSVDGLFDKLYTSLGNTLSKISDKAGTNKLSTDVTASFNTQNSMYRQLTAYEKQILSLTDRMTNLEERYYKQFTAMETALSQLNNQSTSLTNLFNTGN